MALTLYSYWRSTAAYRVRIALNLKGLEHRIVPVNLIRDGGEQKSDNYQRLNPQMLVPTLVHDTQTIAQSLAIIEYLEETFPERPLLPNDPSPRALTRQISYVIAMEMHPLNNLRVLNYLTGSLGVDDAQKRAWYHHWLTLGFDAVAALACKESPYVTGDTLTMADICLVAQMVNAHRFAFDLSAYPHLLAIEKRCLALEAFQKAAPEAQADAMA